MFLNKEIINHLDKVKIILSFSRMSIGFSTVSKMDGTCTIIMLEVTLKLHGHSASLTNIVTINGKQPQTYACARVMEVMLSRLTKRNGRL